MDWGVYLSVPLLFYQAFVLKTLHCRTGRLLISLFLLFFQDLLTPPYFPLRFHNSNTCGCDGYIVMIKVMFLNDCSQIE